MTQHVITEPEAAIDDLASLEEELSEAVSSENFEKAASIRDRLVALRAPGSSAT
jgi:protein-arginine kinase activator protein McsA